MTIQTVASTLPTEIKSFRSAAVSSENKATPFARAILAALVSGVSTTSVIESAIIHAFGNPNSKAGKPIKALTASGDYIVGWGATRKTVKDVFDIFENIDSDQPKAATDDVDAVPGAAAIRPLIVSFILSQDGCPKSLKALKDAVKAAIAAHTATLMGDNSEAKEENEASQDDATPAPKALTLAERMAELIVALDNCTADELEQADDAVSGLYDAIKAAYAKHVPADELETEEVQLAA